MVRSAFWLSNLTFLANLALALSPSASAVDLKAAESAYQQRKYHQVIELLSPNVEKLDRGGLVLLGNAYCGTKNHASAVKTFTAILSKNPNDFEAKTLLGREQIHLGKNHEALAFLKEALENNPKFEPAYKLVAQIYEAKGDKYELRMLYQDMNEKLGERAEFVTELCELATQDGLYEPASKYCLQGTKLAPKEARNFVHLGLIYKETGDPKKAQSALKQAANNFAKSDFAQLSYAKFLDEQKNYIESFVYYQKATQANPKSAAAFIGAGQSALEIQKFNESLQAFKRACDLHRSSAIVAMRKAASVLRTIGNNPWLKKFENEIDTCNI